MDNVITSIHNGIVQRIKLLNSKKGRDQFGQFFIEGSRIVKDALDSNANFEYVVVSEAQIDGLSELVRDINGRGIAIHTVSEQIFKYISDTDTPQGILAVLIKMEDNQKIISDTGNDFIVILENIQDPGNMGTLIRTADASGVNRVIVSRGCVDIYNPKVLRSTMGSIFHLPIIKVDDLDQYIDELKDDGYQLYAAHLKGETNYFEVSLTKKAGIIIGNEANGISEEIAKRCRLIKIPMIGDAESLNASMAGGIIMYEYVRQKLSK